MAQTLEDLGIANQGMEIASPRKPETLISPCPQRMMLLLVSNHLKLQVAFLENVELYSHFYFHPLMTQNTIPLFRELSSHTISGS